MNTTLTLVQPGDTRWLSIHGSISVILRSYSAICTALENIYKDGGDLSSDAGGLLLTLCKESTIYFLHLLDNVVGPLAKVSQMLQTRGGCLHEAMAFVQSTVESIEQLPSDGMETII